MAKKDIRRVITLECTECRERNYTSEKNRRDLFLQAGYEGLTTISVSKETVIIYHRPGKD